MADQTPPPATTVPRWVTVVVAFVAIASYLTMVVVLYVQRDQGDTAWTRALSLFTGIQAVAFAAFGWALGTQVNQGAVTVATNQAREARKREEATRTQLTQAQVDAEAEHKRAEDEAGKGRQLAAYVRDHPRTSSEGRLESAGEQPSDDLASYARALYPDIFT